MERHDLEVQVTCESPTQTYMVSVFIDGSADVQGEANKLQKKRAVNVLLGKSACPLMPR